MTKTYLTRRQVRTRYGEISDITIRRWIDSGRIDPPLRIGNRDYFDSDRLDATDRRHAAAYQQARENPAKRPPRPRKEQGGIA